MSMVKCGICGGSDGVLVTIDGDQRRWVHRYPTDCQDADLQRRTTTGATGTIRHVGQDGKPVGEEYMRVEAADLFMLQVERDEALARVREMEARLNIVGGRADDMVELYEDAQTRIIELEAELVEASLRPVTEEWPPADGITLYWVRCESEGVSGVRILFDLATRGPAGFAFRNGSAAWFGNVTHAMALPIWPPQDGAS